jgi:UPF0716 family protein affecting phage T7 exclusion
LLLMPPVRLFLGHLVARHIVANSQFQGQPFGARGPAQQPPPSGQGQGREHGNQDDIIDVDFEEVVPENPAPIDDHRDDQGKSE